MKQKMNILIIASLLAIIALSSIQYHLIVNTFELKKQLFKKEAKQQLSYIETDIHSDLWDDIFLEKMENILTQYQKRKISRKKVYEEFIVFRDSLNGVFNEHYNREIKKRNFDFRIDYQQDINSLILIDSINNDTLISSRNEPFLLLGSALSPTTRWNFNTGHWDSHSTSKENTDSIMINNKSIHLDIRTDSYIDVPNWRQEVFSRMWKMLVLAGISIVTVIGLFLYALSSLIKQKKNADIKTDFINNITHELKTPLATLSIAVKTLQEQGVLENKEVLYSTINTVDRQRKRLQELIDQVLNSSLGYESIVLHKETVIDKLWLIPLINDYRLNKAEIDLKLDLVNDDVTLAIDNFHLSTTILNVLDNAIKYGGTVIDVSTSLVDGFYFIKIKDNGVGIEKLQQKKVFEKFYRIENQNIHNVRGLGLGLYYVNEIIKAHKGEILLESKLGIGTSITLKIPAE